MAIEKRRVDSVQFNYEVLDGSIAEFLQKKELNMREIVGRAYTELGRELKEAQERLSSNNKYEGVFEKWLNSIGFNKVQAHRLISRFTLVTKCNDKADLLEDLPVSLTYEIAKPSAESTESKRQAKQAVLDGDIKTLKEYRELELRLKEAENQRQLAENDAQILRDTLESFEDKDPEIHVEYVKVADEASEQKLRKYEELFGDVSIYEGKTTRVTNGDAITYTVFEFTEDVRKFVEKYGHLTHFAKEFNGMIGEGKAEYSNAIQSMFSLLKSIERNLDESEVIIINQ